MFQFWRAVAIVAVLMLSFRSGLADDVTSEERALSFAEALDSLQANNKDLVLARTHIKDAEGDLLVAAQKQNPVLSLGSTMYKTPPGDPTPSPGYRLHNYTSYNVGVSMMVERGGKRELRESAANKGLEAARTDVKSIDTDLRLQLAGLYFDLAVAEHKEKIARQYAELYDKSIEAMQLRVKNGDLAVIDLTRAEVEAEQAHLQADSARAEKRTAQWALVQLLNVGDEKSLKTTVEWDLTSKIALQKPMAAQLHELVESRASVIAARLRVEQAREGIKVAQAQRKNDVTVGVAYDHEPEGNNISQSNISLNLSIPLQTRYQHEGEIQKAYVQLEAAEADLQRIRNITLTEMSRARDALTNIASRIERLQTGVIPRAREAANSAEFAYNNGASSLTDLMDARRALQALLLDAVDVYAAYQKALQVWQIESRDESAS